MSTKKIMFQLAMDGAGNGRTIEEAIKIIDDIKEYIDIIEVGTSFILRYGVEAIRKFRENFSDKIILGDMKIMDGGTHHSRMGCEFGADIITVLAVSDKETVKNAVEAAHSLGKEVMVDLICTSDIAKSISLCEELKADYICVHNGVDAQKAYGQDPLDKLKQAISTVNNCKVAVAGGINTNTIEAICRLKPDVVIVGGAVHKAPNYKEVAQEIKKVINKYSAN